MAKSSPDTVMSTWWRNIAINISLVAASVVFALGLAEVIVRVMDLEPPAMWAFTSTVGWTYQPGLKTWYTSPEFHSWVEINTKGFHDREHAYAKPPGVIRILTLGDSFTGAIEVPLEDSFSRLLEKRLNEIAAPMRFEVINLGVGGYSTVNEMLMFREEGVKYHPDLVLVFFNDGDIRDNFHLTIDSVVPGSPYFELVDGRLVMRHFPVGATTSLKRLIGRLRVVRLVNRMVVSFGRRTSTGGGGESHLPMENLYSEKRSPEWSRAVDITRALFSDLNRDVAASGGRLAVVSLGGSVPGEELRRKLGKPLGVESELREFFASLGVPQRWLGQCLYVEERLTGNPIRFFHDRHLNSQGHQVVEAWIETWVRERRLLPVDPTPGRQGTPVTATSVCAGTD
jgi:hypothetical protein